MTHRMFQFTLLDLAEVIFASALTAWCSSWPIWNGHDRIMLAVLAALALFILWLRTRRASRRRPAGYLSACFTGAVAGALYGPLLLAGIWPQPLVDPGLRMPFLISTSIYSVSIYLATIVILSFLGVIGALLFGSCYLLVPDVLRVLVKRWRTPATDNSEKPITGRRRLFVLRAICLLAILAAWWLQIPELHERGTLTVAETMRRPWSFTADGQYLAYLDAEGKLSLFDVQTAQLAATRRLRTDPPTRVMGGNTYPKLARQMWFLPGGRELLLDCWPFGFITIDTATWSEMTPRFAGNRPLGPSRDEMRGNSASGRIMVTSPEHRAYELQNDTTLTIWDMVRHAPVRQVTIRPQQNLWIGDDTVWINEAANVLVLGVRRGTRPGGGTEVWNLDTGARTPLKIINEGMLDPQGKRIAHFHYSLDLETGQQQPILARANVVDFTPHGRSLLAMHGESQNSELPVLGSLISSAFDHRLLVYDAAGRRILGKSPNLSQTFPAVGSDVKIAPDGRHVAVRAPDAKPTTIRIFCLPR